MTQVPQWDIGDDKRREDTHLEKEDPTDGDPEDDTWKENRSSTPRDTSGEAPEREPHRHRRTVAQQVRKFQRIWTQATKLSRQKSTMGAAPHGTRATC